MVMWNWSVAILFWQLSINHFVNVQYNRSGLPRHAWHPPSSPLIVSPTPPLQSADAYVRSVNHVTTKQKGVDRILCVWGSVPSALRASGSPAIIQGKLKQAASMTRDADCVERPRKVLRMCYQAAVRLRRLNIFIDTWCSAQDLVLWAFKKP